MNYKDVLDALRNDIKLKIEESQDEVVKSTFGECLVLIDIREESIGESIEQLAQEKLEKAMAKFDTEHNVYESILSRGHIGFCTDYHKHLSDFTVGKKNAEEVFRDMGTQYKENILTGLTANKEMIEQLVAHRHGFDYITHTQGHDGIDKENNVYEVKNRAYKNNKEKFALNIVFDRLSPTTLRKLDEGRPTIILNVTDVHKVIIEMRIKFSDRLIKTYKKKMENLGDKTSGTAIAFVDYKDDIEEITFVCDDIQEYNLQDQVLEYIESFQERKAV